MSVASTQTDDASGTMLERSTDVVVVADADGNITYTSPSVEHVLGYRPDQFVARLWDIIHPDDRDAARTMSTRCRSNPGELIRGAARHCHADGTWISMDVIVINLLHDPVVQGVVTNFRDVTDQSQAAEALRESEDRFRALVANLSDAIAVVSADGEFTFVGESVSQVLGYAPEQLMGTNGSDLVHPDDLELVASLAAQARVTSGRAAHLRDARPSRRRFVALDRSDGHQPPGHAQRPWRGLQLPRRHPAACRAGSAAGE